VTSTGLYSGPIRERWRQPRYRGELPAPTTVAEDVNPLCGDRVRIMLSLDGPTIADARFAGDSCAICSASADVLLEIVRGKSVSDALAITPGDLVQALRADIRPTRMKCVTLPVSVLRTALRAA
jgi:nitrogen fixation NifU-like protein